MSGASRSYQPVTVKLTQEHIDNGIRKSPCNCPIALALKEHFKASHVYVHNYGDVENNLILRGDIYSSSFKLSANASDFITAFDWCRTVTPISFSVFFPLDNP